jgi:hypothetical protein
MDEHGSSLALPALTLLLNRGRRFVSCFLLNGLEVAPSALSSMFAHSVKSQRCFNTHLPAQVVRQGHPVVSEGSAGTVAL